MSFWAVLAVLAGCPKGVAPQEIERETLVSAQPDWDVLITASAGADLPVRTAAISALIRWEPLDQALGFALAARLSAEPRVRVAAVRALGWRMPEPSVERLLREVVSDGAEPDAVVRSYAAMALVQAKPESQRGFFEGLPRPWANSGRSVGVAMAATLAGVPGAAGTTAALVGQTTLPAEPELVRALAMIPGIPWDEVAPRAEPETRPHAWCAATVRHFPGAVAAAVRDARARDEDGVADAVDAWVGCPGPASLAVLSALPGEVARLGAIGAQPSGGLAYAQRALDGEYWSEAVRALALRGEAGHRILREWVAVKDDLRREVVASALAGSTLPADRALMESFRTDASLRTRAAAAASRVAGL